MPANPPGDELKRRREAAGLTQQALATMLGASLPIVSRWERGINVPRRQMAQRIDKTLTADGALLAAFGYVTQPTSVDSQLAQLRAEVADQAERLTALAHQFAHLQQQIEAGARASRAAHQVQTTEAQSQGAPS